MEFKYNGKNSFTEFGIIAKSVKRPLLPTLKKKQLVIPGRHGSYDFGDNTFDNRTISVLLQFVGQNINDLRLQARNIAAWLSGGYTPLTFDDEPDKYYLARVYDGIDLNSFALAGEATVTFECMPFALYQVSTGEDVLLDSVLPLDSNILLNTVDAYTVAVKGNTSCAINYWGTQEVGLDSPDGSKFDIIITGSFTTLSITLNGKTINYVVPMSGQTLIINNVDATIKIGSTNMLSNCTGDLTDFLKLVPGINTATISGTGLNCSVLFDFRPQYL